MTTYYEINERLFDQIMYAMLDRLPEDMDKREGGVAWTLLAPVALELEKFYQDIDAVEQTAFLIDETGEYTAFGTYIDRRVEEYGMKRKEGGVSQVTVTLSAESDVLVPAFTQVVTGDSDPIIFETQENVMVGMAGVQVLAQSLEASARANVEPNAITAVLGDLAALVSVTNSTSGTGGFDAESDNELIARFLDNQRRQATSGNAAHYERWATEVAGIAKARVLPVWDGNGTVKVVLIGSNGQVVTPEKVAEVAAYIETQRPIGALVTVAGADALTIAVSATVVLTGDLPLADVIDDFTARFGEYLAGLDAGDRVTTTRVGALLIGTTGVSDYSDLTLNGATDAIDITDVVMPAVGAVVLSE